MEDSLRQEVTTIKAQAMETAATLWETLENLPQPVEPVNIFKAVCSIKCAEFMTRVRNHPIAATVIRSIVEFLDVTMELCGEDAGDRNEGFRVVGVIEEAMPLTDEVYNDAAAYATRQHVYDGLIMLSAAKMGKGTEAKAAIENMQRDIAVAMIRSILRAAPEEEIRSILAPEKENE